MNEFTLNPSRKTFGIQRDFTQYTLQATQNTLASVFDNNNAGALLKLQTARPVRPVLEKRKKHRKKKELNQHGRKAKKSTQNNNKKRSRRRAAIQAMKQKVNESTQVTNGVDDENESNDGDETNNIDAPVTVEKVIFVSENYEAMDVSNIIPRSKRAAAVASGLLRLRTIEKKLPDLKSIGIVRPQIENTPAMRKEFQREQNLMRKICQKKANERKRKEYFLWYAGFDKTEVNRDKTILTANKPQKVARTSN